MVRLHKIDHQDKTPAVESLVKIIKRNSWGVGINVLMIFSTHQHVNSVRASHALMLTTKE